MGDVGEGARPPCSLWDDVVDVVSAVFSGSALLTPMMTTEPLEIRVAGDHERSDRDLKFFTLSRQVQTAAGDLPVQPEAVLIVALAYL